MRWVEPKDPNKPTQWQGSFIELVDHALDLRDLLADASQAFLGLGCGPGNTEANDEMGEASRVQVRIDTLLGLDDPLADNERTDG